MQLDHNYSPILGYIFFYLVRKNAVSKYPVSCRYSLDEFGTARRSTVVRGFIDALTRGGPGGTPRPIEMHSHDPLR